MVQVTDEQLEATADGSGAVSVVSTAAFAGATQAVAQVSKRTEHVEFLTLTFLFEGRNLRRVQGVSVVYWRTEPAVAIVSAPS